MKKILLTASLMAFLLSCSTISTDKTNEADYNRGYNKNCSYQYGEGNVSNANCSADTF